MYFKIVLFGAVLWMNITAWGSVDADDSIYFTARKTTQPNDLAARDFYQRIWIRMVGQVERLNREYNFEAGKKSTIQQMKMAGDIKNRAIIIRQLMQLRWQNQENLPQNVQTVITKAYPLVTKLLSSFDPFIENPALVTHAKTKPDFDEAYQGFISKVPLMQPPVSVHKHNLCNLESNFAQLPDELTLKILGFVDNKTLTRSLPYCSWYFYRLSSDNGLWKARYRQEAELEPGTSVTYINYKHAYLSRFKEIFEGKKGHARFKMAEICYDLYRDGLPSSKNIYFGVKIITAYTCSECKARATQRIDAVRKELQALKPSKIKDKILLMHTDSTCKYNDHEVQETLLNHYPQTYHQLLYHTYNISLFMRARILTLNYFINLFLDDANREDAKESILKTLESITVVEKHIKELTYSGDKPHPLKENDLLEIAPKLILANNLHERDYKDLYDPSFWTASKLENIRKLNNILANARSFIKKSARSLPLYKQQVKFFKRLNVDYEMVSSAEGQEEESRKLKALD